jgi:Protein of unknown function (DUF3667)
LQCTVPVRVMAEGDASPAAALADASPAPAHACRNCGAHTTGHYCANCGQETRVALPTFGTFMREAAGRYVALDGRLWRTLFALVARPGFLTLEYFNGRRRRYIRPARLFLVLYLLLFALIGLLQSPTDIGDEVVFVEPDQAGVEKSAAPATPDGKDKATADKSAKPKPKGLVVVDDDDNETVFGLDRNLDFTLPFGSDLPVPAQLRKRLDHFKKLSREAKAEQLYSGVLRYGPYAMVALLPAFALLLKLAYLGRASRYPQRPRRYAEHLVYSAHLHAFAALALLLILVLPFEPLRLAIMAWIVFYVMRARQVVYRGRWWGGVLRAFAIAIAYLVLMSLAIVGLLAMAVMLR